MFNEYKDILTVKDLCEMLGIGKNTAYELVHNGDIKSIKVGRQLRIPKKYIIEFLEKSIPNK